MIAPMVSSALVLLALLGTAALPPAQAHIANALIRITFTAGVNVAYAQRTTIESVVTTPAPAAR